MKMHYDYEYKEATELAKATDKDGELALLGMDLYIAYKNNIDWHWDKHNQNVKDAIAYLTNTYLECIDSISFKEWIDKGNEDGIPMILGIHNFKEKYSEIYEMNFEIQGVIDDIAILYGCEWWIFGDGDENTFLATTFYKPYKKINLTGVHKAMSKFTTVFDILNREDVNLEQWQDVIEEKREEFIEEINKTSNNLLNGYKIDEMDNHELRETVCLKFGLADYI